MRLSTADPHEQSDPAEALMQEVGEQLRQVRVERGQELEQVAESLRIKVAYLQAIERGDMAALPGRTYALGFLRTYADYLGFNGNELISRIRSVVGSLTNRSRLRVRTPAPESRLPKTPMLVLSLALVGGVYGGWIYVQGDDGSVVDPVSEVPEELRHMALGELPPSSALSQGDASAAGTAAPGRTGPPAAGDASAPVAETGTTIAADPARAQTREAGTGRLAAIPEPEGEPRAAEQPTRPAPASPALAGQNGSDDAAAEAGAQLVAAVSLASTDEGGIRSVPDTAPGAEPDGAAGVDEAAAEQGQGAASVPRAAEVLAALDPRFANGSEDAPVVHEAANRDARVILRARSTSWIQVSSEDGSYTEAATLLPGEVFLVPNRSGLMLWTGNAGGLEVIVDGKSIPPLGYEGAVMRRISLDPAALLTRTGGDAE